MVHPKKKNRIKIKCYDCNKKNHYTQECNDPKKVLTLNF